MALTKVDQNTNLGDYCYTVGITLSRRGRCLVNDAEKIAVVISAMMNTSGGVLDVQIDAGNLEPDSRANKLNEFDKQLVRIIVTQEKWIPKHLFLSCVKTCVHEKSSKLCFFVSKANNLVTHCTYAYIQEGGELRLITYHDVICRMLQKCSCNGEDRCLHHQDTESELESALAGTDHLSIDMVLAYAHGIQYFCRYYELHDRPLTEVLSTQSVRDDIMELVSALANGDGGSLLLGVTHRDKPVIKGYTLGIQQLNECLSQLINGWADSDIAIWSSLKPVHGNWKLFLHPVSGSDIDRYVIEIRVRKCPGGMFCSMPLCFEISHSGDILPINHFEEWRIKCFSHISLNQARSLGDGKITFERI